MAKIKKKLKVIVQEPNGTRKTFFYDAKDDDEAMQMLEAIKSELAVNQPNFFVAEYRINEVK